MGAVNYFTSDYITLGVKPYNAYDLEKDAAFMDEIREQVKEYGGTVEVEIEAYISDSYECDRENIESILSRYSFRYYNVTIKPGYYEGFTVDIESNFPVAFDGWEDRRESQKEITQLKKCMLECAGAGLVSCSPGWCTGYSDYKGTCKAIEAAIKAMRDEARHLPTWAQYKRETA